jgi:hypothetical protein
MSITIPEYVLKAIMADALSFEYNESSKEKIYFCENTRFLVITYWSDGHLVFNIETNRE